MRWAHLAGAPGGFPGKEIPLCRAHSWPVETLPFTLPLKPRARQESGIFRMTKAAIKRIFFFKLWQGEKPSVCRDNPSLIVLRRKPASEAKSLPDCHLSAALAVPVKDPEVALVCGEVTPWPCRKAAQCAGCCQYHSWFICYFIQHCSAPLGSFHAWFRPNPS